MPGFAQVFKTMGLRAIVAVLEERKAELSCDRAGLLCGRHPAAGPRAYVGGVDPSKVDTAPFLGQAGEYTAGEDEPAGDTRSGPST
ncbi:hypothetical protein [Amycolatopsis sp.]|uniref:hypothetical protein n=1 Tax=Amycolatopsis sp. TaxID=37632 RepID=UPI002CEFFAF8|nr:hypothetical protein [Amycolatopsis sp.]HVV08758.1 hypothetical protein [Amycolatopsis sp.]